MKMGLPEHFSPLLANPSQPSDFTASRAPDTLLTGEPFVKSYQHPRALLLRDGSQTSTALNPNTLGHQYVFFGLPLTRLYLQHSERDLLLETSLETLQLLGYDTFIANSSDAALARGLLAPRLILKPTLRNISLNAYDAFFFRILSVNGELEVSYFGYQGSDSPVLLRKALVPIRVKQYRRFGHAPSLSYLLKNSLTKALQKALKDAALLNPAGMLREISRNPKKTASGTALLFPPPSFALPPAPNLGELLAASYGFKSLSAYNNQTILRIIQRGSSSSAQSGVNITSSTPLSQLLPKTAALWQIKSSIEEITPQESLAALQMTATMSIEELSAARPPATLLKLRCSHTEPLAKNLDGSWVITLEKASSQLIKHLFAYPKTEAACEIVN